MRVTGDWRPSKLWREELRQQATEIRGWRPVGKEDSADFRKEDTGGSPARPEEWKGKRRKTGRKWRK